MSKLFLILSILSLIFVISLAPNQERKEVLYPEPTSYVVDLAGVLSDAVEEELKQKIKNVSDKSEIAVVTVKTTQPLDEQSYAIELANKWGIGDKDKDDGILFLIVTEDRKLRIEVGSGAEAFMNDAKAGRILDTYVVPELKNNNWEKGIINGTDAILKEVK
jgi:uncharacterized protein